MTASDPELGDLVEMVGVEIRIAQILADKVFAEAQHPEMAPGHYTVLSLIDLNPGINQSALARCMFLDRSSMVPILDQFEKREWIRRSRQANDRRSHAVNLTSAGRRALKQADSRVRELEEKISLKMGKGNRNQLLALTRQLQEALRALQAE